MNGFLCVNKPCGPSSFQIVDQMRRILRTKKIGHAGTLDPQATGLLVLAIGTATRLLQYLPSEPKQYDFGIQFGSQTDTLDREGKIILSGGTVPVQCEIDSVLSSFTGCINQAPPAYSAILINGVRAYKLARGGEEVQMQPRPVQIYHITLKSFDSEKGEAHLSVECSGGTYVRSLARDIAAELGTFGYASYVHRTGIGQFQLCNALAAENLDSAASHIISFDKVFTNDVCQLSLDQCTELLYGRNFEITGCSADIIFAFTGQELVAVMKRVENAVYHPSTVISGSAGQVL